MDHAQRSSASLFNVYLRLRPSHVNRERFLDVEEAAQDQAPTHITIKPSADDKRKRAVEKFAFTRVFEEDAGQVDLFHDTGAGRMIEGVLGAQGREGRDGLIATLGVTGSGKSHTILGSKSQRGLTQLTLDVLFQHTAPYLAAVETSSSVFPSLCQADASEAQLMPASYFLDTIYDDSTANGRPSRAATPGLVRNSTTSPNIPGSFPSLYDSVSSTSRPSMQVFDRLYPSLSRYQLQHAASPPSDPAKVPPKSPSRLAHLTRSIAKLTLPFTQDTSFVSTTTNYRRHLPRLSLLPQTPTIEDADIAIDSTCEYALIISMYEVYNDRIFDLLTGSANTSAKALQKRRALLFKSTEHSPDRKVVAGLRKVVCSSLDEALLVLEAGLQERRVAGTGSNAVSSRSHGFFCLDVKKRHRGTVPGPWTSSTLTIVDLAGSERARAAKTAGATLAEAGKINESLMYLGQCMQMQSDNAHSTSSTPAPVPFRQCKLTELLFSNAFTAGSQHKPPQKAVMIVTADPWGDYNATSQILRYSALAREVEVPRQASWTGVVRPGTAASGRLTPAGNAAALQDELENALAAIAALRGELEVSQLNLREEARRRREVEASWQAAETRMEVLEQEIRDEVWSEMEAEMVRERRRWAVQREEERERVEEHVDAKIEILARAESAAYLDLGAEEDKENVDAERVGELETEVGVLKGRLARVQEQQRSPSKKVRVLKSRRWDGSGMGVDEGF